ncbi:MAG TPA: SGNH/GDSL hydrolase family protein [Candidatus Limnocylindria bacterium]|nr:SGNH/GDSL hydrolase family protein [Candidatus Limnocylindria bacterium]
MISRLTRALLRVALVGLAAVVGILVVQVLRLRRTEFLPLHPGFYISHWVEPHGTEADPRMAPLRLLTFGDSTTAGVGVDRAEDALPMLLAQRLADDTRRTVRVLNFGWSGARVADLVRDQIPRSLESLRQGETPWLPIADVVIVVVGANDATHRTSPRSFRADTRWMLEQIRLAAPDAQVVLAGVPRFRGALRDLEPLISMFDAYAVMLRRIQRQEAERAGVTFAPLASDVPRLAIARGASIADVLASDRFHPSPVGYRLWAEVIGAALERR